MKTLLCLICLTLTSVASLSAAEPVVDLFREGLFEEEANRNLPAAIQAYEKVVQHLDEQRRLAATTLFRLGECYRKLGRADDAVAAYERVLREFPLEDSLAKLSRENLALLRPQSAGPLWSFSSTLSLPSPPQETARDERRALLQEEIALVEQALAEQRKRVQAGVISLTDLLPLERDLLSLQGELAASMQNPTRPPSSSKPTLFTSKEADEITRLQALVVDSPDLINAPTGNSGMTELMTAAEKGQVAVAQYLLDHGARVDVTTGGGSTALHFAVSGGHLRLAELLIDRGAAIDGPVAKDNTPLHNAAARGYLTLAKLLLSKGAQIDALMTSTERPRVGTYGGTPLWTAVVNRQTKMVEFLLDQGADPNLASEVSSAPLTAADEPELIHLLLDKGADPNVDGGKPLLKSVAKGDLDLVKWLVERGADLNPQNERQVTPLMVAVCNDRAGIVEWLLGHDVALDRPNQDGNTALHLAAWNRSLPMVERLLDAGASREVRNVMGQSPLELVDSTSAREGYHFNVPRHQDTEAGNRTAPRSVNRQPSPDAPELRRLLSSPDTEPRPDTTPTP
jgi:ankyrin repeat protein